MQNDIAEFKPDVIIIYPGFNMRIAKWARKASQHTITYRPKYGLGKSHH
jgi:lipid A disaccharide synthetase